MKNFERPPGNSPLEKRRKQHMFLTGKKRKNLVNFKAEEAEDFKKYGLREIQGGGHYTLFDSPLDGNDPGSFFRSFQELLPPEEKNLGKYIEKTLEDRKGNAIGVEFGGPGIELFSGFTEDFFKQSVGVTLVDYTNPSKKRPENHAVLEGDVLSPETYDLLNTTLEEKKVDLIIERMAGGLEYIPHEPFLISKILGRWYKILNEGGIMFVQTPAGFNTLLDKWATMIQEKYKSVIELHYKNKGKVDAQPHLAGSSFSLRKLPGAPKELPFLDVRTVYKTPRDIQDA